jgi:DNA polymerase I
MAETLYLIDGHSQIYRAYYAPFRDLTSPTGEPTRATYVFTQMLLKFIEDQKPTYLAMAVDGPRTELKRTKLYPDYKVTRKPMPDDLKPQEERIFQVVRTLGVPILRAEGYEADDIIATLADRYASDDLDVVVISRDKDLDQLVGEHVVLYDPMKGETLDAKTIEEKKGYPPEKAVEIQTLTGDSTDNIPGVPGVGPKTAVKLIGKYRSAAEVLAHADEQTPKLAENLRNAAEAVELSRRLVTLDRDVPLDAGLDDLRFDQPNFADLSPIFQELGFNKLMDRLRDLAPAEAVDEAAANGSALSVKSATTDESDETRTEPSSETSADAFDYRLVDTPEGLAEVAEALAGLDRFAVDTETTDVRPMWAKLVGISLSWESGRGVYLPVAGPLGATALELDDVRNALAGPLADESVEKVGHHLKYDRIVLDGAGLRLAGPMFDTMIAAHVLDSSRMTYKLDALSLELLNHRCIPIAEIIGTGKKAVTMDAVPTDTVAVYAAEDADVALRLADALADRLADEHLRDLFDQLEMPLMPILAEMERKGIRVDPERLKAMEVEFDKQADKLRDRIVDLAGRPFNPDSPKQLAEILFDEMLLPVLKKTKTGPSTDMEVLERLAAEHDCELAERVLEYRKLTKLLGTYLKALAGCIHPRTKRVHTSFHQASVETGRLSSSDPNLQNIPIRSEQGRQIRSAFVADEGCLLLSADYSQVELRMLAHFCRDETLLAAFAEDQDIHRTVAAEVFEKSIEDVTADERARAKTVNFGIIYGQTAFGLSRTLRIPRNEAESFIRRYRKRFPKIDEFLQQCIGQAKRIGYVETIFGRRRAIPEIGARNAQRRAAAERLAINSVVQGSAADLIKQAMLDVDRRIRTEDRPSRMLLQIHDELVFEVPEPSLDEEREMIVAEMTGAIELAVPLKVDTGSGKNWLEAK